MARRQIGGRRVQPWGIEAYVKVGARQLSNTFPLGTPDETIAVWCATTRAKMLKAKGERGTLAYDIDRFLNTLDGRRKTDFSVWLFKWRDELGHKARIAITDADVRDCFNKWKGEKYSASSLNHLRTVAISLWKHYDGRRHDCPVLEIPKFKELNVRKGFFEHDQFLKVREQLPEDYRDLADFLYYSGWRHGEARGLLWSEVDLLGGVIRLSPERTKTKEGRILPIEGAIKTVITVRQAVKCDLPEVFHYKRSKNADRAPIGGWGKPWRAACVAAGCPGAYVHDFRRTVVRNLTRAGAPEKIAMAWTGHKTRAVFDRYNIVNESDLRDAFKRLEKHVKGEL